MVMRKTRTMLAFLAAALLSSCTTTMPMQTLFVREGVLQYYIPESSSRTAGYKLDIDLTFRDDPDVEPPVTINYSLHYPPRDSSIPAHQYFLTRSGARIATGKSTLLYRERSRSTVRISTVMSRIALKELLSTPLSAFVVELGDSRTLAFPLPGHFSRELRHLSEDISP
ncbi:MAG: hypothetical protein M0001_05430 [Treponema sp.]|nr:hypothetical protein [Treponema sp.]